jgi:calcineurin-like phosphoesterase family protein
MANLFIISDTHFGHANILNFVDKDGKHLRTFGSVEEMDQHMVDRWNSVVRPQDHVYHLGDVAMKQQCIETVARCNGRKRLVRGNHDIFRTKKYLPYFEEIYGIRVLDGMIFTHIPIHPESLSRFKSNVHGHVHAQPQGHYGPRYYNVSVEAVDYTPVALEDLKLRIKKQQEDTEEAH